MTCDRAMDFKRVLISDGGFSTQLAVHVGDNIDGDPLWTARFNYTNPNAIIKTHLDFLNAGVDIIETNTYQASVEGYAEFLNLNKEDSIALIEATVKLAHDARKQFLAGEQKSPVKDVPMIFASIGPYAAHLHNASEYRGSYAKHITSDILKNWHRIRIEAVLKAGVDALAIETIPCQIEAESLIDLLCDEYPDVKFWISFQCQDEKNLAHGESFRDAAVSVWERLKNRGAIDNCLAIGVNCVHPKLVTPLFQCLSGSRTDTIKLPFVVYPNSTEIYDLKDGWTENENNKSLESYIPEWIDIGIKILGGCCRTGAKDIIKIKKCVLSLATTQQ